MRNQVFNPNFDIWQRGSSFSCPANDHYTADKWQVQTGGGTPATYTISRDKANARRPDAYCLKFDVTNVGSGITNSLRIQQRFPVSNFLNQTVSASVWVKTTIAGHVRAVLDGGDAGTFSSYHTGSGDWEQLTITKSIASNATMLRLKIGMQSSTSDIVTGTWYLSDASLVFSGTPEDCVPLDPDLSLLKCLAYYEKFADSNLPCYLTTLGTSDGSSYALACSQSFKAIKADTPNITIVWNSVREDGSPYDQKINYTKISNYVTLDGFFVEVYKSIGGSKPSSMSFSWTAEVFETY